MKVKKYFSFLFWALIISGILISCPNVTTGVEIKNPVTDITVTDGITEINEGATIILETGKKRTLIVSSISPAGVRGAAVTWSEGNADISIIPSSDGFSAVAEGIAEGSLTVTVSVANNDNTAPVTRTFTVSARLPAIPNPVTGIFVKDGSNIIEENTTIPIDVNEIKNLTVTVDPVGVENTTVTWSQGNTIVSLVPSSDGLSVVIKGLSPGGSLAVTVSASNTDNINPVTRTFTIQVKYDEIKSINKHQFRGVWISTAWNIDIANASSQSAFQTAYTNILNTLELWNMNAIIFQVSPMGDAFYNSAHRPWSSYFMNSAQGLNASGWDPLPWMIEEAHKKGIEFHAWFNPYRIGATALVLAPTNYAVLNPGHIFTFNGTRFLDPGYPQVRQHFANVIKELIENYDVDAVHIDDYFYPYNATQLDYDQATFELHGTGFAANQLGRENWRRYNNDELVKGVWQVIKAHNTANNKTVQFGVSPFGIWEHAAFNPSQGSNTSSGALASFRNGGYADTRKWIAEGWADYMIPQLYWHIGQTGSAFDILLDWWANLHTQYSNVHLYIGHANYKHVDATQHTQVGWQDPTQIPRQLDLIKEKPIVKGSSFYSYRSLINQPTNVPNGLPNLIESNILVKARYQEYKTLVPPKPWIKSDVPATPLNVSQNNNTITWTAGNDARYYVVYRITTATPGSNNAALVIQDASKIIGKVWRNSGTLSFTDTVANPNLYTYIVTAVSGAHVESVPVIAVKQ